MINVANLVKSYGENRAAYFIGTTKPCITVLNNINKVSSVPYVILDYLVNNNLVSIQPLFNNLAPIGTNGNLGLKGNNKPYYPTTGKICIDDQNYQILIPKDKSRYSKEIITYNNTKYHISKDWSNLYKGSSIAKFAIALFQITGQNYFIQFTTQGGKWQFELRKVI